MHLCMLRAPTAIDEEGNVDAADAFEEGQKKAKGILWWEVGLVCPVVFIYAAARGYMIVEAFVSLQKVPLGVYGTVEVLRCHRFGLSQALPGGL